MHMQNGNRFTDTGKKHVIIKGERGEGRGGRGKLGV